MHRRDSGHERPGRRPRERRGANRHIAQACALLVEHLAEFVDLAISLGDRRVGGSQCFFNLQTLLCLCRIALVEVLLERGKREEGRAMLQRTLDAPLDPDWTPEDEDFKRKTRARLGELGR